jgi:hypothetical protein
VTASVTGSLGKTIDQSARHQFYAVDVDLRHAFLPPPVSAVALDSRSGPLRIRSVWVPGAVNGILAEQRTNGLWTFLEHAAVEGGLRMVVMPRSSETTRGESLWSALRKRMRVASKGAVRLAIGVRGATMERGHDQLGELLALRHAAEEWDLDLALDLSGDVPHYLEAEAAILRLLPRLTLVRIPSWVSVTGELNTNDPISRRVVAILADQGYAGTISIIPARSPMQLPWTRTYPSAGDEWTRSLILDQYDRQRTDERQAPYISPELFREQR